MARMINDIPYKTVDVIFSRIRTFIYFKNSLQNLKLWTEIKSCDIRN